MRSIPQEIHGFTPVIDDLVNLYGVTTAMVFGRIWRYCQMDAKVCFASQARIAKDLHYERETINRHILILVRDGFLRDVTPDAVGTPHIYADTGKASIKGKMTGGIDL